MNILLDYFFPITSIEPTPAASTAFLKQVCVVGLPLNGGVETGEITLCTTQAQVDAILSANASLEVAQLFAAGMSRVHVLPVNDLDLASALEGFETAFYTLLLSSDFDKDDVEATQASLTVNGDLVFTAVNTGSQGNDITITLADTASAGSETVAVTGKDIVIGIEGGVSTATQVKAAYDASAEALALATVAIVEGQGAEAQAAASEANLTGGDGLFLGTYSGVVGVSETDDTFLAAQAVIANRCAFHTTTSNKARNMFFAFGKMLSNALRWRNQQYIQMPLADDVNTLGAALNLFEDRISFVISDAEFGNRLALFSAGGKAITAPYIKRNLELDLQSRALTYISGNQPAYNLKQAALIQDELEAVIEGYINDELITAGTVAVGLEQDNFVASGDFNISEPKALWRIVAEMRQTL